MLVRAIGIIVTGAISSGCTGVPHYAVDYTEDRPTIATVVARIECELVNLVRNNDNKNFGFQRRLVKSNYVVAMDLTLEATHSGALTPSLNFPIIGPQLAIKVAGNFTRSRKQTFTRKLRYSFGQLYYNLQENGSDYAKCPDGVNYNLKGDLGIRYMVAAQMGARATSTGMPVDGKGEFGGSVTFGVTKNINSAGPTWTFTNFVGPGGGGKLERKTRNVINLAFARSPGVFDPNRPTKTDIETADQFLTELLIIQNGL